MMKLVAVLGAATVISAAPVVKTNGRFNEVWTREQEAANGVVYESHST